MSDTPESLAAAVAVLQTNLPDIKKSETAVVETQKGRYSYTYANLAAISREILPRLGELGLSFIAKPTFTADGRFVLAYKLLHTSGQFEEGEYPLPPSGTPQAIGSAITYGRRYALCAVTGIAPEDDDDASAAEAEAAATKGTAKRASRERYQPPPTSGRGTAQRIRAVPPPLPDEDSDENITAAQRAKLMALFGQINISERPERLEMSSHVIGRELGSANDLTKREAVKLIDALEQASHDPNPLMWLDDFIRSGEPEP
jgi:hypothetical protein